MSETGEQPTNPQKLSEKHFYRKIGTALAEKAERHLLPDYMKQIRQRNIRLWEIKDKQSFDEEVARWTKEIRDGDGKEKPGLKSLRGDPDTKPHVSIVIPAHNEEKYILQMLQSISEQKYDKGVEVLIMDNNSSPDDRTAALAEQCGVRVIKYNLSEDDPESKFVQEAWARQSGLEAAKGEIVISSDGDAIVPHGWISAMSEPLDHEPAIAVVTGGVVHYDRPEHYLVYGKDIVSRSLRKVVTIYRNRQLPSRKQKSSTMGGNTSYRKADAERIGGYDLYKYPGLDSALGYNLSKLGRLEFIDNEETRVRVSPRRFEGIGRIGIVKGLLNYRRIYRGKDKAQIVKR